MAAVVDAIGGSGGLISLPIYLLVGLPYHNALGTNKMSSCIGTAASTFRYVKNGYVNWRLAAKVIADMLPWLEAFGQKWLEKNKPSELFRIQEMITWLAQN